MTQQADGHDPVQQITHALEVLHSVVTGIADRQWEAPTPCGDWDVREVLNHTVGGMQIFAAQLTGRDAGKDHEADWLGEDPLAAFDLARTADLEAWRRPGSTSRSVTISLGRLPGPMAAVVHPPQRGVARGLLAHRAGAPPP